MKGEERCFYTAQQWYPSLEAGSAQGSGPGLRTVWTHRDWTLPFSSCTERGHACFPVPSNMPGWTYLTLLKETPDLASCHLFPKV